MLNFNFCVSTNFIFGKKTQEQVGPVAASYGVKRVMLVYDSGDFLKKNGLLDSILDSLRHS